MGRTDRLYDYLKESIDGIRKNGDLEAFIIKALNSAIEDDLKLIGDDNSIDKVIEKNVPLYKSVVTPFMLSTMRLYKMYIGKLISFKEFQDILVNGLLVAERMQEIKNGGEV